jgi:hypothetical protein
MYFSIIWQHLPRYKWKFNVMVKSSVRLFVRGSRARKNDNPVDEYGELHD